MWILFLFESEVTWHDIVRAMDSCLISFFFLLLLSQTNEHQGFVRYKYTGMRDFAYSTFVARSRISFQHFLVLSHLHTFRHLIHPASNMNESYSISFPVSLPTIRYFRTKTRLWSGKWIKLISMNCI